MTTEKPLSPDEIEHFHRRLIEERERLLGDMDDLETETSAPAPEGADSNVPTHPADAATDERTEYMNLRLEERDRETVREIDDAIERIRSGEYGVCMKDGGAISRERLEAKPWARYCKTHARIEKEEPPPRRQTR